MKPGKIRDIIEDRLDELEDSSEKISVGFKEEDIHCFRVGVKSLRAVFRLLNVGCGYNEKILLPHKFMALYKAAGRIRDAQLALKYFAAITETYPSFGTVLQHNVEESIEEWKHIYASFAFSGLRKKIKKVHFNPLPPVSAAIFLRSGLHSVRKLSARPGVKDEEMHNIRKLIKDLILIVDFISKDWKAAKDRIKDLPVDKLEQVAATIGEYNDTRMRVDIIRQLLSASIFGEDRHKYGSILADEEKVFEKWGELVSQQLPFLRVMYS